MEKVQLKGKCMYVSSLEIIVVLIERSSISSSPYTYGNVLTRHYHREKYLSRPMTPGPLNFSTPVTLDNGVFKNRSRTCYALYNTASRGGCYTARVGICSPFYLSSLRIFHLLSSVILLPGSFSWIRTEVSLLNPSNAEATFDQLSRMQNSLKTI